MDCGAYVGDTIERYIWKRDGVFKKIIGFEPDKKNFLAMWNRVKRLNLEWGLDDNALEIYEKGVADRTLRGRVERYANNHTILYFHPDPNIDKYLESIDADLSKKYEQVVSHFIAEDSGIYDSSDNEFFMVCLCDRFIGDRGTLMYKCMRAGKRVDHIEL